MIRKFGLLVSASVLAVGVSAIPAYAQDTATPAETETPAAQDKEAIIVTGSRIKQDPNKSALPLQIITNQDLAREGISSPEQMLMQLSTNGSGADNLASNADVVSGAQRGTNGLSSANLRGQGSAGTLILLNGRRIAAHGLSGSAVDVNQIPFAAIERIEVLKDGASAIYGTDAVGGVINYITRKDYQGVGLQAFTDFTEQGGGNIYRISGIAGWGDLNEQGFNVMGAVSYRWNEILNGDDRDWTSGNQPDRGLSIDTRGTPIATIFPFNSSTAAYYPVNPITGLRDGTLIGGTAVANLTAPFIPGTTTRATGGINVLNLTGGAGCDTMDGGMAYDYALWNTPNARYACAWDTGRSVVLQQPIKTLTYYGRATARIAGEHEIYAEVTGSRAKSAKLFSNAQVSANTTNLQVAYPLNDLTRDTYNSIFNQLVAEFPSIAANYGRPIGYRWRCIPCGQREYNTDSKTFRAAVGVDGPIGGGWDYRVGGSFAQSQVNSELGGGYYYRGIKAFNDPTTAVNEIGTIDPNAPIAPGATYPGLVGLLNAGILNPFSLIQTPAALAALESISARGEKLYGGKYQVRQLDASVSGSLFALPGGDVKIAVGVDYRKETYRFDGSDAGADLAPNIFLAAFDNVNALKRASRTVKAAYAEVLLPIFDILEVTGAARIDDYTGFGSTINPKVAVKFTPTDWVMFRASYSTGFRVPSFNQLFNGQTESDLNTGANVADPATCPKPTAPDQTVAGCALITPTVITGGNPLLGPEKSKMASAGIVLRPSPNFSASVDWWKIDVDDAIALFDFRQLLNNYSLFEDRFIRDASGAITEIDSTWANAGGRRTQGLEVSLRGGMDAFSGRINMSLDGTYLLKKKERLLANAPWSQSLIGLFTYTGDLGLRWKHSASLGYSTDKWNISLSQIFRKGYKNQMLPGIAAGLVTRPDFNEKVKDYVTYNFSTSYDFGGLKLTAGIRNLFDRDPPFAISYDSLGGSGGSWEPRVADPRGRSYTLLAEVKF